MRFLYKDIVKVMDDVNKKHYLVWVLHDFDKEEDNYPLVLFKPEKLEIDDKVYIRGEILSDMKREGINLQAYEFIEQD